MACARCGCGVYQTEDLITMNKIWHKCCFTCRVCKEKLDKCSAKVYRGEIFCEKCYKCTTDRTCPNTCTTQIRPCRVVSSPSSLCIPKTCKHLLPKVECGKKYDIWLPDDGKVKTVRSCSCIPDIQKAYCFPYPIPPEVANYYNRNMGKKNQTNHHNCCQEYCTTCCPRKAKTRVKMRKLSPTKRCPSPLTSKNTCPEPCKCQKCNVCVPSRKCCPSPAACYCSCSPGPQEPYCPSKQKQEKCCANMLKQTQAIFCPAMTKQKQCCPNKQKHCQIPKCCCKSCSPKSCPEVKQFQKKCCNSSVRYCTPTRNSPCEIRCVNDSPKCACSAQPQMCCTSKKTPKYCICGSLNPCNCKISQVKSLCQSLCVRCGQKVYAAEKIIVTSGAYHTSCFSCYCCQKLLDIRNVQEHCNEIYCRNCYNYYFGLQYYGYGSS